MFNDRIPLSESGYKSALSFENALIYIKNALPSSVVSTGITDFFHSGE